MNWKRLDGILEKMERWVGAIIFVLGVAGLTLLGLHFIRVAVVLAP